MTDWLPPKSLITSNDKYRTLVYSICRNDLLYLYEQTGLIGGTVTTPTGDYTALLTDGFIVCDGTFTVTLPPATATRKILQIKNIGTGTITVDAGSETIDAYHDIQLLQWDNLTVLDYIIGGWIIL